MTHPNAWSSPQPTTERTAPISNVIDLADHRPQMVDAARATYTVGEVAAMLGLSRANTYVLLKSGDIPARRLGNRWIIPRYRFHQWLDTDTTTGDIVRGSVR